MFHVWGHGVINSSSSVMMVVLQHHIDGGLLELVQAIPICLSQMGHLLCFSHWLNVWLKSISQHDRNIFWNMCLYTVIWQMHPCNI